ncbi:MAG: DNA topoisomerase 3 [Deltaproteobacteria bacterium]|nr:DNA topoisomerase 3 [Deltaproteobacteria bacterium]
MGFRLVVAEKPSVARDIARVLGIPARGDHAFDGGGTRVTWCLGHLLELAEPAAYDPAWKAWSLDALPLLPPAFRLQPRKASADQWRAVRDLMKARDLDEVVNACDAGREGELIFAWAYELAGCRAPVRRLWVSSLTDEALREGFAALRPPLGALEAAARCRAEADWLVGLNATRAMTLKMGAGPGAPLLSVGRVQTPTLALLCAREAEIEAFVPQAFWQVIARFGVAAGEWEAVRVVRDTDGEDQERLDDRETAEAVVRRTAGQPAEVATVEPKERVERPPLLFDLTALQREANQRFGFTAAHTLAIAQSLYERHKVLTYPRTDSRHLPSDLAARLPALVHGLAWGPYAAAASVAAVRDPASLGPRFVDDREVSDHHAIVPTGRDPRPLGLETDEKRIFDLVARRFLGAFHPDARFALLRVETHVHAARDGSQDPGPEVERFVARGRTCLEPGWQSVDPPASRRKEVLLPPVLPGDAVRILGVEAKEGRTQPPRRHTEASLLGAMERAGEALDEEELRRAMKRNGLGTPATRAAILETLLERGYLARRARELIPTPRGQALVEALPVEALRSPRLTGAWESRLAAVAEGTQDREAFMADVRAFTVHAVDAIRVAVPSEALAIVLGEVPEGEALGACPRCGQPVVATRGGWRCTGCPLFLPGRVAGREVSPRMARRLLAEGETEVVKGFRSKEGRAFSAALHLEPDGRVALHFPKPSLLGACPACGQEVRRRGEVYTCATGRACPFVVFGVMSGRAIPEEAVRALLADGRSGLLEGFRDRDGHSFAGRLVWNRERVVVVAADPREDLASPGSCPRCGEPVRFHEGAWRCAGCTFQIPAVVARRDLAPSDVAALLAHGRTARLHGFRQASGAVFKARLVLDAQGHVRLDWTSGGETEPLPEGAPAPAFGRRVDCPRCVAGAHPDPGYLVAGREAWGCSRWRDGCAFRIPYEVEGLRLPDEEALRLVGRARATRFLKGFAGRDRTARLVLQAETDPPFRLEVRGQPRRV